MVPGYVAGAMVQMVSSGTGGGRCRVEQAINHRGQSTLRK